MIIHEEIITFFFNEFAWSWMNECLDYVPLYKCFETWFFTQRWAKFCMNGCLDSLCIYLYFDAWFFRLKSMEKEDLVFSFDFKTVVGFCNMISICSNPWFFKERSLDYNIPYQLQILIREARFWISQCLDHDVTLLHQTRILFFYPLLMELLHFGLNSIWIMMLHI